MRIRTVIADDHAVFRSGLRALLEKEEDMEVVSEAGTGQETLDMVEKHDFDILTLDISMPGMSGNRIAEQLIGKWPDLAIIVLTMHEDEHYVQEFFRIGVRGYVLKKSTCDELLNAIRAVFRGQSYIDPALVSLVISPYVGKLSPSRDAGRLGSLTPREKEVCRLLAKGLSHAKVAESLHISPRTVESHRANIMGKLELENRADLVQFAIENQLLEIH